MLSLLLSQSMFATLATLAAVGPIPVEHPATCRHALRQYASLADVPRPYVVLDLASADPTWGAVADEPLDRAARVGATGYVLLQVPGTLGSNQERRMLGGARATYRTVAVLVPSDTARAHDTCRRVASRGAAGRSDLASRLTAWWHDAVAGENGADLV